MCHIIQSASQIYLNYEKFLALYFEEQIQLSERLCTYEFYKCDAERD